MKKLTIFITILILGLSFSTIVSANMNNGHKVVPMVKTYDLDKKDDNGANDGEDGPDVAHAKLLDHILLARQAIANVILARFDTLRNDPDDLATQGFPPPHDLHFHVLS